MRAFIYKLDIISDIRSILLTKTTAAQSDDALSYYTVRGLHFLDTNITFLNNEQINLSIPQRHPCGFVISCFILSIIHW